MLFVYLATKSDNLYSVKSFRRSAKCFSVVFWVNFSIIASDHVSNIIYIAKTDGGIQTVRRSCKFTHEQL